MVRTHVFLTGKNRIDDNSFNDVVFLKTREGHNKLECLIGMQE